MPTSRAQQRADQRSRILEAARRGFALHGPEAVTMADVARAAGVARATVFNHFGSKHALMDALTEEVMAGYVALLDEALAEREVPVPLLLRALFEQMGRGIEAERGFYRGVFREIARLALGLEEGGAGPRARQAAVERLTGLLLRGQARGEVARHLRPEAVAIALDSLVFGTLTHWLYDDAGEPLEARMERAAEILLGPVASDAAGST